MKTTSALALVAALAIANSTDPLYVAPDSIPWLLLRVVGTQFGPTGGRQDDGDDVHSARQHGWRPGANDRVRAGNRRRQEGAGTVSGRVRLLPREELRTPRVLSCSKEGVS